MKNVRQFVENWPAVELPDAQFDARVYQHVDGRRHVFFSDPQRHRPAELEPVSEQSRIGFRIYDDEVMFLGMVVAKNLRGRGLGRDLICYFSQTVISQGYDFVGTGYIHKPLVALSLGRAGLSPEENKFMAEILPRSSYASDGVPKIHIFHDETAGENVVTSSHGGRFYEAVPTDERIRHYPINSPDMTVALHTTYLPQKP